MIHKLFDEDEQLSLNDFEQSDENEIYDEMSYDENDFISKPVKSKTCTIDENVLRHQYPLTINI